MYKYYQVVCVSNVPVLTLLYFHQLDGGRVRERERDLLSLTFRYSSLIVTTHHSHSH